MFENALSLMHLVSAHDQNIGVFCRVDKSEADRYFTGTERGKFFPPPSTAFSFYIAEIIHVEHFDCSGTNIA